MCLQRRNQLTNKPPAPPYRENPPLVQLRSDQICISVNQGDPYIYMVLSLKAVLVPSVTADRSSRLQSVLPVLTGVVPAAAGSGSSPPGAVELTDAPVFDGVVLDGVGGQSAHLDARVVTQEFVEGHPAETGQETLHHKNRTKNVTRDVLVLCRRTLHIF